VREGVDVDRRQIGIVAAFGLDSAFAGLVSGRVVIQSVVGHACELEGVGRRHRDLSQHVQQAQRPHRVFVDACEALRLNRITRGRCCAAALQAGQRLLDHPQVGLELDPAGRRQAVAELVKALVAEQRGKRICRCAANQPTLAAWLPGALLELQYPRVKLFVLLVQALYFAVGFLFVVTDRLAVLGQRLGHYVFSSTHDLRPQLLGNGIEPGHHAGELGFIGFLSYQCGTAAGSESLGFAGG